MKTTHLHIFEYLQKIQDSQHDQSLNKELDNHIADCADCHENMILIQHLHNAGYVLPIETNGHMLSNSKMVSNIKHRIRYRRFLPMLVRPLPEIAWITIMILTVVLLSWGITRLRAGQNIVPATSNQISLPSIAPTKFNTGINDCRTIIYTVENNNTLLAIAAYFNVAVDALWRENHLGNNSVLKPGMSLSIPFCGWIPVIKTSDLNEVAPINNCPKVRYIVQQGDTVKNISTFFNVPVATIITENQLDNNTVLSPNNRLIIKLCKNP